MRRTTCATLLALGLTGMLCSCGQQGGSQAGQPMEKSSEAIDETVIDDAAAGNADEMVAEAMEEDPQEENSDFANEFVTIQASPDKYTWYMQNYVGMNLANAGYTSLGGDRLDRYGSGYIALNIVTADGSAIDIEDDTQLQQYVVVKQSYAPNTEIKFTYQTDSDGNEYDSLLSWQNISNIDVLVSKVGEKVPDDAPELIEITPSPDKYNFYIQNYVGKNLFMVGYTSLGGKRMDAYGDAYIELNLVTADGSYIDLEDDDMLKNYYVTAQDVAPNTQLTVTYETDSNGEEYDNLIDNQNISKVSLKLEKIKDAQ